MGAALSTINTVVCLHGIWMHGVTMLLVKRRLEKQHGFDVHLFNYPSVSGTLDDNAMRLSRFIEELGLDGCHVVGHSLGGVIALRMYAIDENAVPGRCVALGAPLSGSRAADFLATQNWARPMLGNSLTEGVVYQAANDWASHVCETRDIGIIAGTMPLGAGHLVARFDGANDGTVAVVETELAGAKDHLCMNVSHTSMLASNDVIDQTAAFLRNGAFDTTA